MPTHSVLFPQAVSHVLSTSDFAGRQPLAMVALPASLSVQSFFPLDSACSQEYIHKSSKVDGKNSQPLIISLDTTCSEQYILPEGSSKVDGKNYHIPVWAACLTSLFLQQAH